MTYHISVFGGASPRPGTPVYQEAYQLGQSLGKAGLTVLTGGYMGTMEAVSRGAAEAGARVIGVTSEEIETFRPIGPNQWVSEEWRCRTFKERLLLLVEKCDAAIALPGGLGTLAEISLTWNNLVVSGEAAKPLILIGSGWRHTLDTFFAEFNDFVSPAHREYLTFVPDSAQAVKTLRTLGFLNERPTPYQ